MTPNLIGITGRKGSGKDTAAAILTEKFGFRRLSFADPLRVVLKTLFNLTDEEMSNRVLKEQYLDRYPYESPREILQKVGTECMRSVYPDVWIEAFRRESTEGDIVCADVRFMNEALHIRSRGGVIIKIDADERLGPSNDGHSSETELLGIEPDFVIPNNTTEDAFKALSLKVFTTLLQKDPIE